MKIKQLLLSTIFLTSTYSLYFKLPALPQNKLTRKCISQWIPKDLPVKVQISNEQKQPGQTLSVTIKDDSPNSNQYAAQSGILKQNFEFVTQSHANVMVCFENLLTDNNVANSQQHSDYYSEVYLKMESGASSVDFLKMQLDSKLNPIEVEMRRLESNLEDVQESLAYLKIREGRLRDMSEIVNSRVSTFSILTLLILISITVSQVFYLRRFFKAKKLI
ncbi:Endoplasmic reticulum vesicle protein 25 [Zancudomyces culisetae]|uniref:Endoplasmic reticulum vesicle protein 25 n=1 Tax=Zancudomyces culisetae TaxID=1213189 RepID=A0A1R1PW99_ZANCU|nr:Endoplasmic reticulum vesicle protein 25 [Zancudomyces culisetae]|eukprot:OMH85194.1 Endoplasmic reticulum vesicle protein 25 [Zancudomyces culisetae]